MRKRIAALALASVMALSLFGCGAKSNSASSAAGVSGDFTGTAKGMGGDVTVTLTLTDSKITGCTAEGADETQGIGTLALEQLPGQIAETGSIAVDGVSGATITSDAIKEAAAAALVAAGPASYGLTDSLGRVHGDAQFAGSSSVPAHVEMMGLIGMGNNPMVGATVACAVAAAQANA